MKNNNYFSTYYLSYQPMSIKNGCLKYQKGERRLYFRITNLIGISNVIVSPISDLTYQLSDMGNIARFMIYLLCRFRSIGNGTWISES